MIVINIIAQTTIPKIFHWASVTLSKNRINLNKRKRKDSFIYLSTLTIQNN